MPRGRGWPGALGPRLRVGRVPPARPPAAAAPVLAAVAVAEPVAAARPAGAEVDLATLRASLGAELADLQRREDAIEHFCQKVLPALSAAVLLASIVFWT